MYEKIVSKLVTKTLFLLGVCGLTIGLSLKTQAEDPFTKLPTELSTEILKQLEYDQFVRAREVSKLWEKLASEDVIDRDIPVEESYYHKCKGFIEQIKELVSSIKDPDVKLSSIFDLHYKFFGLLDTYTQTAPEILDTCRKGIKYYHKSLLETVKLEGYETNSVNTLSQGNYLRHAFDVLLAIAKKQRHDVDVAYKQIIRYGLFSPAVEECVLQDINKADEQPFIVSVLTPLCERCNDHNIDIILATVAEKVTEKRDRQALRAWIPKQNLIWENQKKVSQANLEL